MSLLGRIDQLARVVRLTWVLHLAHTVGFRARRHGFSLAGRSVADNAAAVAQGRYRQAASGPQAEASSSRIKEADRRATSGHRVVAL